MLVRDTFHFAHADGTPCYAWAHQGDALEEQTLETLKTAGFNKNEPVHYPFENGKRRRVGFHSLRY